MWPFHTHKWEEVSCDFTPPSDSLPWSSIDGFGAGALIAYESALQQQSRAIHGFTTTTFACATCGKRDYQTTLGDRRKLAVQGMIDMKTGKSYTILERSTV